MCSGAQEQSSAHLLYAVLLTLKSNVADCISSMSTVDGYDEWKLVAELSHRRSEKICCRLTLAVGEVEVRAG